MHPSICIIGNTIKSCQQSTGICSTDTAEKKRLHRSSECSSALRIVLPFCWVVSWSRKSAVGGRLGRECCNLMSLFFVENYRFSEAHCQRTRPCSFTAPIQTMHSRSPNQGSEVCISHPRLAKQQSMESSTSAVGTHRCSGMFGPSVHGKEAGES